MEFKEINTKEITSFLSIYKMIEERVDYVFYTLMPYLEYGEYSSLENFEIDEDKIIITYYNKYYDLYDGSYLRIPIKCILSNESIENFINEFINKKTEEKEKLEKEKKDMQLQNDLTEFERLKKKLNK